MGRKPRHTADDVLDVAQRLVLEGGTAAGSVTAIARAGGMASGSIYHRFASRDELLVRLWIRAIRRTQGRILDAAGEHHDDPVDAAVALAVAVVDTCVAHRADARLLLSFRREDLLEAPVPDDVAAELRDLNRPVGEAVADLVARLAAAGREVGRETVVLAVLDLPYGAVRRHLVADRQIPEGTRDHLAVAVRAVLAAPDSRIQNLRY